MSIVSGQDSRLQIGLANDWRVPTRTKQRLPYTQEGFKGAPNYKESEALVGASGITSMSIMSFKADGSFTSYLPVDVLKLMMFAALGFEKAPVAADTQFMHEFTPVSSSLCANLPSLTVEVDRLLEKAIYMNYKINTWKISGKAEDYIMFECDGPAFKESIQNVLYRFVVKGAAAVTPDATTGLIQVTLPDPIAAGLNASSPDYPELFKIVRIQDQVNCGEVYYFNVVAIDSVAKTMDLVAMKQSSTSLPAAMLPGGDRPLTPYWESLAAIDLRGLTLEIVDWEMAPLVPVSTKEFLRFVHGYLYIDEPVADYRILGSKTGVATDSVIDCPVTVKKEFEVEGRDLNNIPRIFKYLGADVEPIAGLLTFADTPTAGQIASVFVDGALNSASWEISEDLYDEVTDFTLNGENQITDGRFGMNGSMYQSEVNPSSRDFNLDLTARFTRRFSELRKKRMMNGVPCNLRLVFETKIGDGPEGDHAPSSTDSNGKPYKVVIDMPKGYYIDGIPNISGADEPTISPKFRLAETPGIHKAITVKVYDDKNETVSGVSNTLAAEWKVSLREDAYFGE